MSVDGPTITTAEIGRVAQLAASLGHTRLYEGAREAAAWYGVGLAPVPTGSPLILALTVSPLLGLLVFVCDCFFTGSTASSPSSGRFVGLKFE
jgi:hypothetical protein